MPSIETRPFGIRGSGTDTDRRKSNSQTMTPDNYGSCEDTTLQRAKNMVMDRPLEL
jgi:hypothetical protein